MCKLGDNTTHSKGLITCAGEAKRMNGVTRGSIFRFHSPGKRDYLEITTRDPGIIILGSQLTGLARLS